MRSAVIFKTFIVALLLWRSNAVNAAGIYKKVELQGLKIHSEKTLINDLKLYQLEKERWHFLQVARQINTYYYKKGYILVKTYLIEETGSRLKVFVDEGRLGKIIFNDLDSLNTLKMRYEFRLPGKIYNKYTVDEQAERIRKKYRYKKIYAILKPTKSFEKSMFQLDREFDVPGIGITRLPFFSQFAVRYDMEVEFVKRRSSGVARPSTSYGLDLHYTKGLIPFVKYRHPGLIYPKDRLEAGASMGIYYGLDLDFTAPPEWTFMEAHSEYYFAPAFKDYFTPRVKGSAYHSRSARTDLGLLHYNYLILKGSVDPGITLLRRLRIYAGYGNEKVYIYNSEEDPGADYNVSINEDTEFWNYLEFSILFRDMPWDISYLLDRRFTLRHSYYFNGNNKFHEMVIQGKVSHEFKNLSLGFLRADYSRFWRRPPFYHEFGVSSNNFKGLMGKGYHTRRILRADSEYWVPLYRDFIYGGVYADATWFEGSGYDLSGEQGAVVAGISGHFIILDQFEFNIYYGWDLLFSTRQSQGNLYFNLEKKW